MISPQLHITILGKRIRSFHFFGTTGYVAGIATGLVVTWQLQLDPGVTLLMAMIGALTFFGLAFLAKIVTGDENIVYYHHEISIIMLCALMLFIMEAPVLPYLDITLLGIGVFLAFGRIGCYAVGCCHGRPCAHGVRYGQRHVDEGFTWYYKDVSLLPVQLIESLYIAVTVITGVILLFNHVAPGTVLLLYTVVYGIMRFVLEFFRGDPERPAWHGLSEAQWTTLVLIAATLGLSRLGWLPAYNWHLIIFISVVIASLTVVWHHYKKEQYALLAPRHLKQLAEGLKALSNENKKIPIVPGKIVNIYTTGKGLCLSCGRYTTGWSHVQQYTVSLQKAPPLDRDTATAIARQIRLLKGHPEEFEIIDRFNGVYHILFVTQKR